MPAFAHIDTTQSPRAPRRPRRPHLSGCAPRAPHHRRPGLARALALRHLPARLQGPLRGRPRGRRRRRDPRHRGARHRSSLRWITKSSPPSSIWSRPWRPARRSSTTSRIPPKSTTPSTTSPATSCAKSATSTKASATSDLVIEREFRTQRQQHAMLEPHVTIAWLDPDDRLVIRTSTQVPYHCRRQVAMILQIPVSRVHVDQAAHRRRLRRQAGNAARRHLRRPRAGRHAVPSRSNTPARKSSTWRAAAIRRSCA